MSDSPVSPEDLRAAAETYQELGPEYHDAVVAAFLDKIDREVAARVEARLAGAATAPPAKRKRRRAALTKRRVLRDVAAAGAGALAVVAAVAVHSSAPAAPNSLPTHERLLRPGQVPDFAVVRGQDGKITVIQRGVVVHPPPQPPPPPKP